MGTLMRFLTTLIILSVLQLSTAALGEDPNLNAPVAQPSGASVSEAPEASRGVQGPLDIRVDFGNTGTPPAANWNLIAQADLNGRNSGLVDFNSGLATSVAIDGTGSSWANFFGDDDGSFPNQAWIIQPAPEFGAGLQRDAEDSFLIEGLPDIPLQIEIVSARPIDYQNIITIDGSTASRTGLGTPVNTPWGSATDGLQDGNWLIWDDVSPDGGAVTLTVSGDGTLSMINALRILSVEVVEPAPAISVPVGHSPGWLLMFLAIFAAALVTLRRAN